MKHLLGSLSALCQPANLSFVDPLDFPNRCGILLWWSRGLGPIQTEDWFALDALGHHLQGRPQFGQKKQLKKQKHSCPTQFQPPRPALQIGWVDKKLSEPKITKCRLGFASQSLFHIQVVPGRAGGGSFKRKKNHIAEKEFAYRMCARWPTIAMSKLFFGFERSFCRCMAVMSCDLGWCVCDLTSFHQVMWLVVRWFVVLLQYYSVLQRTTPVLLCTTKYYSSTTLYYKVLLQYHSVLHSTTPVPLLQSTTPVLLCTTKYYSSTTPVLQSTTPVLLCTTKYYSSTTLYYKELRQYNNVLRQYYKVLLHYYSSTTKYYSSTTKYYATTPLYYKVLL